MPQTTIRERGIVERVHIFYAVAPAEFGAIA
jgi:hypothetical protein